MAADIAANIAAVRERIARAAERSGRGRHDVTLVAVTKTQPVADVLAARAAGVRDFGENRVQEAAPKVAAARAAGVDARWHLVGHLQRNKARAALGLFDILHSVDANRLARALEAAAPAAVPVLIEVNVSGEASKFGVTPAGLPALADVVRSLPRLDLRGLMTVAPQGARPDDVRGIFRRLRRLNDGLRLPELSMGMTDDFEIAIEEGATLVRIGRAIFGARESAGGTAAVRRQSPAAGVST